MTSSVLASSMLWLQAESMPSQIRRTLSVRLLVRVDCGIRLMCEPMMQESHHDVFLGSLVHSLVLLLMSFPLRRFELDVQPWVPSQHPWPRVFV